MPTEGTMLVFASVSFVLAATPGPGVIYLVGRAIADGRRAGIASMLGIELAELVYLGCVAVGLSAVIAQSVDLLNALRYAGAVYLIVLGIHTWRRSDRSEGSLPSGSRQAFAQGVVTQLVNPKVALFFFAYFPQFVRPGNAVALQVLILGSVYLVIALATDIVYVLSSSWLAARFARAPRAYRRRARLGALVYVALGVGTAIFGSHHDATRALGRLRLGLL